VYLTADDQDAPYVDVKDGVSSWALWASGATVLRFGRLDGITDPVFGALSGAGMWSDNCWLTGKIYAREGHIGDATNFWLIKGYGIEHIGSDVDIRIDSRVSQNAGNPWDRHQ